MNFTNPQPTIFMTFTDPLLNCAYLNAYISWYSFILWGKDFWGDQNMANLWEHVISVNIMSVIEEKSLRSTVSYDQLSPPSPWIY